MSMEAASGADWSSPFEQLRFARDILRHEGQALLGLAERLQGDFCEAVDLVYGCSGSVIVTGMGKAGLVGQKIAATLASTGTHSHFLHPGEAVHGDLGRIHARDVVLALSFSGATQEVVRLLPSLQVIGVPLVAVTGDRRSPLAVGARVTLDLGPLREACWLGLAPSTSTTAMLALGDALALVISRMRRFGREDFARYHPGGSLGRKLAKVEDVMRPLDQCRVADQQQTIREVFACASRPGRRTGAIMLTDAGGRLTGLFTDSDLARLLERKQDGALDRPICETMTRSPVKITLGAMLDDAFEILAGRKFSELPVVDESGKAAGLIDITDLVSVTAEAARAEHTAGDGRVTVPFPAKPRDGAVR